MSDLEAPMQSWISVMRAGSQLPPTQAIYKELQEYSGLAASDIDEINSETDNITKKLWQKKSRKSSTDLDDFYDSVDHWVFGTMEYHAKQAEGREGPYPPFPVRAATALSGRQPGHHLDFGCGVATASLLFAKLGWRVTAADISKPLLNFAHWRMKSRGIDHMIIDLKTDVLPEKEYDLVTAFNTFAHVPDPGLTLRQLNRSLRDGGSLIFDIDSRSDHDPHRWHLYSNHRPFLRLMRRHGFAKIASDGGLYIYDKVERGRLSQIFVSATDAVLYSAAGQFTARIVRGLRRRLPGTRGSLIGRRHGIVGTS